MNEKLVIRELRARWHQKSARRKSHGMRLKNQAWRISRSRRLITSFTRPSASGDRPSPSSKHSPRTQSTKLGGGSRPSVWRKTCRTACGGRAWVEWLGMAAGKIALVKHTGPGVFSPASMKRACSRPTRSRACSMLSWKSSISSTRSVSLSRASQASRRAAKHRPDGVVAAARVAHGEDDDGRPHYARLRLCTSRPSASTSSTASGILPSAWVAQDRQGSKARMATSMWLSRPSVTSRPCR